MMSILSRIIRIPIMRRRTPVNKVVFSFRIYAGKIMSIRSGVTTKSLGDYSRAELPLLGPVEKVRFAVIASGADSPLGEAAKRGNLEVACVA
jgi:hypothetical protein